jgi:hypothetical protein
MSPNQRRARVEEDEPHFDRQHRLSYFARGPEWAFAIAQGDLAALDDVMRRCSTFWNGVNALIVPVSKDGRISPEIRDDLFVRGVDQCFVHESVESARAKAKLGELIGATTPLWDEFDRYEPHPLFFQPMPSDELSKPSLTIPRFESASMRRLAIACWGVIPDDDLPHWHERFNVGEFHGDHAIGSLVNGQLGVAGITSPLLLSAWGMSSLLQRAPFSSPHLAVFDRVTFTKLVFFWNWRARSVLHNQGQSVVGVPAAALSRPDQFRLLRDWAREGNPFMRNVPDLEVAAVKRNAEAVRSAMQEIGFDQIQSDGEAEGDAADSARPVFRFRPAFRSGSFIRGAHASSIVAVADGKIALRLRQPAGMKLWGGHVVRLVLRELPLPLPLGNTMARAIHQHATAADGLMIQLETTGDWDFDIALPTRADALQAFATDKRATVRITQDGRYAAALLNRLGSIERIDALASADAIDLLTQLVPVSRVKAAQRLRQEFAKDDVKLDEERLAERLKDMGLLLEAVDKPVDALASGLGRSRHKVLDTLTPLVEAGVVARGRALACPVCNFRQMLDLADLDEIVRCRACRAEFSLPVSDGGGREPALTYRLDGLMARVMDQDILPVLLTVRAVHRLFQDRLVFTWPGVEFATTTGDVDVDVLLYNQQDVYCCEVKANAGGLDRSQFDRIIELCDQLEARPAIAALSGEFEPELAAEVRGRSGLVLHRGDLL